MGVGLGEGGKEEGYKAESDENELCMLLDEINTDRHIHIRNAYWSKSIHNTFYCICSTCSG